MWNTYVPREATEKTPFSKTVRNALLKGTPNIFEKLGYGTWILKEEIWIIDQGRGVAYIMYQGCSSYLLCNKPPHNTVVKVTAVFYLDHPPAVRTDGSFLLHVMSSECLEGWAQNPLKNSGRLLGPYLGLSTRTHLLTA